MTSSIYHLFDVVCVDDKVAVDDTVLCQCIALYDHEAKSENEITIYVDDVIQVFEKGED